MSNKIKRGNTFHEVKSSLNIVDVVSRLGAQLNTQNKNTLLGTCPVGHPSSSKKSFHVDTRKQLCHCFNCGMGGDVFSAVETVKKISKWEALKWLVSEFDLKIDTSQPQHKPKLTPEEILERDELRSRSFILEEIVEKGKHLLFQEDGKEALEYLVNERKYDPEIIKKTEWFYLPEEHDVKMELINEDEERKTVIGKLSLQGYYGDNFRLAFPYRNSEGLITGFLKRSVTPEGKTIITRDGKTHDNVRWDSTSGLNKDDLFGLDKVDEKIETLITVEGYPDALYLKALGMENIVAVGQGKLGKKHLEGLRRRKIKNLIISFDNDDVGPKNTPDAVELILKNSNIVPYVIDPKNYGDKVKDPDEYLIKHGYEMLKNLFQTKAEDGAVWVVKGLIKSFNEANPMEKKEIKENVMNFLSLVKDETSITEILESIKTTFGDNLSSIKKQLKSRKKDYKEELIDHITNDPIIPFNDNNSNSRCYYDAVRDILNLGIDKEFIKEVMLDYGLVAPESYPVFTVKFDPQDLGWKFDVFNKTFNLFTPTEYMFYEKNSAVIDLAKNCPAINTVISNVVPDPSEKDYFLNWLSFTFSTRKKSIVAWLIRGTPGTGKNLMFEKIITPLWGKEQCTVVGNAELDSQFNPYMKHKLMIAYNEVTTDYRSDKKDKESKIKAYVSDPTVTINEKNVRQYDLENFSSSLFFSNYQVPIIIEDEDRRFNVVENFSKLRDHPYYKKFKNHDEFLKTLHSELPFFAQFLINYKYDSTKAVTEFMNDAKKKIIGSSMGMFEEFAKKLIARDYEWLREESGVFLSKNWDLETVKDGYIFKDVAVDVFNRLYGKNLTSPKVLSTQLQHYGIDISGRVTIGSSRPSAYTWK